MEKVTMEPQPDKFLVIFLDLADLKLEVLGTMYWALEESMVEVKL